MNPHIFPTFAVADMLDTTLACGLALAVLFTIAYLSILHFRTPYEYYNFGKPIDDATFEDSPDLGETGIACEIARLPAGSQLVEIDTAGMLTPPGQVIVNEYRWTGSTIEFVRRVPLHEFSFVVPHGTTQAQADEAWRHLLPATLDDPETVAAREQFMRTAAATALSVPPPPVRL